MTKRKHSSSGDDGDAAKFLESYFRGRGMDDDALCSDTEAINKRADVAREDFKRARLESLRPSSRNMSGSEKYERRLANNRNSAAASRVFREVQKREFEYGLRDASERAKKIAEELAAMQDIVKKQDAENELLRQRILALESNQCSPGSPIEVDGDDGDDEMPGLNEFPSMFGGSQSEQRATVKYGGLLPPRNSQDSASNDGKVEELIRKIQPSNSLFNVGVLANTGESPQNLRFSMESQEKLGSQCLKFPLSSQESVGKIEDVPISEIADKIEM